MSKIFMVVFVIFGTVVGSGFASGKEIMVFFSRFGNMSYLYICLAGILFFFLFYFFLKYGSHISRIFDKSKILNFTAVFISFIFASSMFAGVKNLFSYFPTWAYIVLAAVVLVLTLFATFKGIRGLEKVNVLLMPLTCVCFLIVLVFCSRNSSNFVVEVNAFAGLLYSPLYVALNTCMSGVIISKVGEGLSKKQTLVACLFSVLLLLVFLFLGNFVLLKNGESYYSEMPFLYLAKANTAIFVMTYIVILIGCLTTLISLCYTINSFLAKFVRSKIYCSLLSVFTPFAFSSFGFSQIVSLLYPFCSVLGIYMLVHIILVEILHKHNKFSFND